MVIVRKPKHPNCCMGKTFFDPTAASTLLFVVILAIGRPVWAAGPFTVDTTSDTHAANAAVSPNDGGGHVSLRSAI